MTVQDNVIAARRVTAGVLPGALGVLAFSFSLPATRLAVRGLDPWVVAFGRAAGAGLLAAGYLYGTRAARPAASQLWRLAVVASGVVVGFPLFSSLALTRQTASHGAVVIAVLPAATAVFAAARGGERPSRMFWLAAAASFASVLGFVAVSGGLGHGVHVADLWLLLGATAGGLGYAEGGALSRQLGGAQTICWALVISLPVTAAVSAAALAEPGASGLAAASGSAWLGFAYVTTVSMFLGFFAWYAGLARGGVAKIAQVQSLQPVLTLAWSALLLGEHVTAVTVLVAVVVLCCVFLTQRAR